MGQKRAHISLRAETQDALHSIKAVEESYDGIVQELIKFWMENNSVISSKLSSRYPEEALTESKSERGNGWQPRKLGLRR